jgi:hypothetical protein
MSRNRWRDVVRFGLPGLLLGGAIAGSLGAVGTTSAQAQVSGATVGERSKGTPPGDGSGTIAFTSATNGSAQLLYLIDTKTRAFAVYRVDPANAKGTVKLEAVRQYQWDLKLAEYNNSPPEVAAIESSVKNVGRAAR